VKPNTNAAASKMTNQQLKSQSQVNSLQEMLIPGADMQATVMGKTKYSHSG